MLSHQVLDVVGPRKVSILDASSSTQIYGKVVPTGPALAMPSGITLALFPARCLLGRVRPPTAGYQSSPDSAVLRQLLTPLRYQVQACSWRTRACNTWLASAGPSSAILIPHSQQPLLHITLTTLSIPPSHPPPSCPTVRRDRCLVPQSCHP